MAYMRKPFMEVRHDCENEKKRKEETEIDMSRERGCAIGVSSFVVLSVGLRF
jgi:hypothetical protein